jgi:hypothetical protein
MRDDNNSGVDDPSFDDVLNGLLAFVTGPVLGATMCPGATLCVPAVVLFVAPITIPIVVITALAIVLAAIAVMPYLLLRSAVRLLRSG